jgi:hypothetical protein
VSRRGPAVLAPVIGLAVVLSGCAHAAELEPERAEVLQTAVLTVSEEVAAGRYDTAQAALAQAREHLEHAVDAGEVSTVRYRQIDDALDRTAQEVAVAVEAQVAARAAEAQAAAEQAAAEQAAAEQAAAEQAALQAAEQAAAEAAARAAHAPGGDPKDEQKAPPGNSKGKGKGKPADG